MARKPPTLEVNMTNQEKSLIFYLKNYQDRQKVIDENLKELITLARKGESNTEEAIQLKQAIYIENELQKTIMGELSIGTDFYDGTGLFFANEYKYPLRENTTKSQLKRVHKAFLKAGLELDGVSPEHEQIIKKIVG